MDMVDIAESSHAYHGRGAPSLQQKNSLI